jgi:uncharacterized membrane protein
MSMTKTVCLVLVYIACGATGDLMLSYGMKARVPAMPWLIAGTAVLALGYAVFLGLLKDVPLSVVVPAGAGSYIIIAALSHLILHEHIPVARWLGTVMVSLGVGLVMVSDWQTRKAGSPASSRAAEHRLADSPLADPVRVRVPTSG